MTRSLRMQGFDVARGQAIFHRRGNNAVAVCGFVWVLLLAALESLEAAVVTSRVCFLLCCVVVVLLQYSITAEPGAFTYHCKVLSSPTLHRTWLCVVFRTAHISNMYHVTRPCGAKASGNCGMLSTYPGATVFCRVVFPRLICVQISCYQCSMYVDMLCSMYVTRTLGVETLVSFALHRLLLVFLWQLSHARPSSIVCLAGWG